MKPLTMLCLAAAAVVAAGCATRTAAPAAFAASTPQRPVGTLLQKGMTAGDVRALLGAPRSVERFRPGDIKNEVWIYTRPVDRTTTVEATRTREVPYFDPFLNAIRMIPEPDYQPLSISVDEIVTLLFIEDRLAEWKVSRETQHDFN